MERVYRIVELPAADVRENGKHIMNERPTSPQEQRAYLFELKTAADLPEGADPDAQLETYRGLSRLYA